MQISKATLHDVKFMQALIQEGVDNGTILPRTDNEVATNIRSYLLMKDGEKIVGMLALHIHVITLAEIRSLYVEPTYRHQKVASRLIKRALEEAKALELKEVLVLTYLADYFKSLGFVERPKESLPESKIWVDCIKCTHFPVCNETALIYQL
jgi:amino-acid N-acetyltransferase